MLLTNHRLTKRGAEPWVVHRHLAARRPLGDHRARASSTCSRTRLLLRRGQRTRSAGRCTSGRAASRSSAPSSAARSVPGSAAAGPASDSGRSPTPWRPGLLLAQAMGRFGNWFNQELFGLPTDLPWGLEIDSDELRVPRGPRPRTRCSTPRSSTRCIWNVLGVLVLLWAGRKLRCSGAACSALYLDLVQRRPHRLGVDPHRPERDHPRSAHERLGRDLRRHRRARRSSSCRSAATPASSRRRTCRVADVERTRSAGYNRRTPLDFVDVSEPPATNSRQEATPQAQSPRK